jgi:hypothetical protein
MPEQQALLGMLPRGPGSEDRPECDDGAGQADALADRFGVRQAAPAEPGLSEHSRQMGERHFTDGTTRPVFELADGRQYVEGDDGTPVPSGKPTKPSKPPPNYLLTAHPAAYC